MAHSNARIAKMMQLYDCDESEAVMRLDMYEAGRDRGIKEGQAEAQRFFRISLGIEAPEPHEAVLWNNPVPLRKEEA